VPALLVGLLSASPAIVTIAFLIALGHALVLGIPFIAVLWWNGWVNVLSATLSGFVIGALGIAVSSWPLRYPELKTNAWTGAERVQTMADGVPTLAGWVEYLQGVAFFGILGVLGGFAWWSWLKLSHALPPEGRSGVSASHTPSKTVWLPLCVAVGTLAVLSIPAVTKDRSCHNVLRDGRTHISSQINIDLEITDDDWVTLREVFEGLAAAEQLSFRDESEVRPDVVRTLYLSICNDAVAISTNEQRWASGGYQDHFEGHRVAIGVYETSQGSGWADLARRLIDVLEQRWPTKVRFRDGGGHLVPMPESVLMEAPPIDNDNTT
jgi:hypothetical protein